MSVITRSFVPCRLCDDYEMIAEKALTTPANTEQLIELKEFIDKVEKETIFVLEKRLIEAKNRLTFLVDYASFSPAEMRLNSNTFMWHSRMAAIFEEHKLIISEKKAQYEEALKVCKYSTIQYNTIQYNTIQYNTIQYNTIQ